jgi:hypothetical protein
LDLTGMAAVLYCGRPGSLWLAALFHVRQTP